MGLLLLLVLLVAMGWIYSRLRRMEEEIHAEIEYEKALRRKESAPVATETVEVDRRAPLSEQIFGCIETAPGCSQAEVYASFPEQERSKLQKTLRDMARDGLIRRERKGSSYLLYPV